MMKRLVSIILVIMLISTSFTYAIGEFDDTILQDTVSNIYTGTRAAVSAKNNINFNDVPLGHWAKEAVTRAGALNIIKGYERNFRPNDQVTNQEAIAFILRALGKESEAQLEAERLRESLGSTNSPIDDWGYGYLSVAQAMGIINQQQLNDAMQTDNTLIIPGESFNKNASVTREQISEWLIKAINNAAPNAIQPVRGQQNIYMFSDWQQISLGKIPYVEAILINSIMSGDTQGRFNPKAYLTRAELAQIMKNMDDIYFSAQNMKRTTGYVGEIMDELSVVNGSTNITNRNIYVRNSDGTVDKIITSIARDIINQTEATDVVVFKDGLVSGISEIKIKDQIEYITNSNNEILYISATPVIESYVEGRYKSIDLANRTIVLNTNENSILTYRFRDGLADLNNNAIVIDDQNISIDKLPFSTNVRLLLRNNIVEKISVIGEEIKYPIVRGIVKNIDKRSNIITILDENNTLREIDFSDDAQVERNEYYYTQDDIGYIDQMFPNNSYDKRDSNIDSIEIGDVVELSLDENNIADKISVDFDLIVKYGKVMQLNFSDPEYAKLLIEYEDLSNELVEAYSGIPISKNGRNINIYEIMQGDWVKLLIKRAVLKPGKVDEQVKEILVNGREEYISNIYRGQVSSINKLQNELVMNNVETLFKTGWREYKNIFTIKIDDNAELYNNGTRISLDYANNYLRNSNSDVYIAVKKNFNTEKAIKVSFRNEKEQILNADNVNHIDGNGSFRVTYIPNNLLTDGGTIVRRYGRLVNPQNINMLDYVKVVLNGDNKVAIADITDEIDNSKIQVYRGRIKEIEENRSFTVTSFATLQGNTWKYVPSDKKFEIDYNTRIYDSMSMSMIDSFIDYTNQSKLDKVYTVISSGGKALRLNDAPYCTESATGEVYDVKDGIVFLKDVKQYNTKTSVFEDISRVDKTLKMEVLKNGVIINNSQIVSVDQIKIGDKIRLMTDRKPIEIKNEENIAKGYIVFIEK